MTASHDLTTGKVFPSLMRFAGPVLLALLLQALYGAVDLWVVGRFAAAADVSGVTTGSQILNTLTMIVTGFAMGLTVLIGQTLGGGQHEKAGRAVGCGILMFAVFGALLSIVIAAFAPQIAFLMNAPQDAIRETVSYIRICGFGMLFITAYNVLGAVFRGIGDANTPLLAVAIAAVFNIGGDLFFVAVLHMGAAGAALATVISQALSVLISLFIVRRRGLPFPLSRRDFHFFPEETASIYKLGAPIALQECLVGVSFLFILAFLNARGVLVSAGVGIAEKLTAFILLVPISMIQTMAAFTAQNFGAKRRDRARQGLLLMLGTAFLFGVISFWFNFFHGEMLVRIFTSDERIIPYAADYLKSYAIDCLLTPFLFCFNGFFSGAGHSFYVMAQGLFGAFGVRVPLSYAFSRNPAASLFHIGLAIPISTVLQIFISLVMFIRCGYHKDSPEN